MLPIFKRLPLVLLLLCASALVPSLAVSQEGLEQSAHPYAALDKKLRIALQWLLMKAQMDTHRVKTA